MFIILVLLIIAFFFIFVSGFDWTKNFMVILLVIWNSNWLSE